MKRLISFLMTVCLVMLATQSSAADYRRDVLITENYVSSQTDGDTVNRIVARLVERARNQRVSIDMLSMEGGYIQALFLEDDMLTLPYHAPDVQGMKRPPSIHGRLLTRLFTSLPADHLEGLVQVGEVYKKRLRRLVFILSSDSKWETSSTQSGIVAGLKIAEKITPIILTAGNASCTKWLERVAICMPLTEESLKQHIGF